MTRSTKTRTREMKTSRKQNMVLPGKSKKAELHLSFKVDDFDYWNFDTKEVLPIFEQELVEFLNTTTSHKYKLNDSEIPDIIDMIYTTDCQCYAEESLNPSECVGVCYSGGYDSVLLIAEAAARGESVLPIRLGINEHQKGTWILAEYALLCLRRKYPGKIYRAIWPVERIDYSGGQCARGYYIQPAIAYSLAFIGESERACLKEIQAGFICKDECISFLDEFTNLYHAANKFIMPYDKPNIPLTFPLKKYVKSEIIQRLKSLGLFRTIPMITCEHPESHIMWNDDGVIVLVEPCTTCMSCHTMTTADEVRQRSVIIATFGYNTSIPTASEIYRDILDIWDRHHNGLESKKVLHKSERRKS